MTESKKDSDHEKFLKVGKSTLDKALKIVQKGKYTGEISKLIGEEIEEKKAGAEIELAEAEAEEAEVMAEISAKVEALEEDISSGMIEKSLNNILIFTLPCSK